VALRGQGIDYVKQHLCRALETSGDDGAEAIDERAEVVLAHPAGERQQVLVERREVALDTQETAQALQLSGLWEAHHIPHRPAALQGYKHLAAQDNPVCQLDRDGVGECIRQTPSGPVEADVYKGGRRSEQRVHAGQL